MICAEAQTVLHAYFDRELDPVSSFGFEKHLEECRSCRARLQNLQLLRGGLSGESLYFRAPAGLESRVHTALGGASRGPAQHQPMIGNALAPRWAWAAIAALIVVTIALGWKLYELQTASPAGSQLAQAAVASHLRALMPGHLTDVESTDQHTVKPWFNGRLDYSPPVTDFSAQGFPLVGGRLDYLAGRPIAALVYQRRKHLIDLFVWPTGQAVPKLPEPVTINGYHVAAWTTREMNYCAVSDLGLNEFEDFSRLIRGRTEPQIAP